MNTQTIYKINAKAPTAYQYKSLTYFALNVKECNGSFIGEKSFNTEEEAKQWLRDRAFNYFDDLSDIDEAYDSIDKHGVLSLDAVTASIEKLQIEGEMDDKILESFL